MAKKSKDMPSETDGIRTVAVDAPPPSGKGELKGPPVTKWAEGLEVSGAFLELKQIVTQYGESELLEIGFADGKRAVFGAPAILANRVRNLGRGVGVTIRCLGKGATASGQMAWQFKVWADGVEQDGDVPF